MANGKNAVLDRLRLQKAAEAVVDVEVSRAEWLNALEALMKQFRNWLSDAEGEGLFVLQERAASLTEPGMGTYEVNDLVLTTPKGESISIQPRARHSIGSYGRVDLSNPPRRMILVRSEPGHWQVARLSPSEAGWTTEDLDEDSFWRAIGELIS